MEVNIKTREMITEVVIKSTTPIELHELNTALFTHDEYNTDFSDLIDNETEISYGARVSNKVVGECIETTIHLIDSSDDSERIIANALDAVLNYLNVFKPI